MKTLQKKKGNAGIPRPMSTGSLNHSSKLTETKVAKMRAAYELRGLSICALSKLAGVDKNTAYQAVLGNTWNHVGIPRPKARSARKLTDNTVRAARVLYAAGLCSQREIAQLVGLFQNGTRLMLIGRHYRHVPMPKQGARLESTEEHVAAGIAKRLHMLDTPEIRRAISLGFRAGHHLAQIAFDLRTDDEVMGAGNQEYAGNRLDLEDIRRLHHAYEEEA